MMKISITNSKSVAAVINYKDGRKRHGLLMNDLLEGTSFRFIPYNYFRDSADISKGIEIIPAILIEAIETDLK